MNLQQLNKQEWLSRLPKAEAKYRPQNRYKIALQRLVKAEPQNWIDVGAGNGYLASIVKPVLSNVNITGIDFVEEALSTADSIDVKHVVDLDMDGIPSDDESFDYVTCLEVLEHVIYPDKLLSEIRRILKPGGSFLISAPNLQFVEYLFALMRGKMPPPAADLRHLSIYTKRFLVERLQKSGLRPINFFGCDASPDWFANISRRYLCKTIVIEGKREND